jgi:hypothetical protein
MSPLAAATVSRLRAIAFGDSSSERKARTRSSADQAAAQALAEGLRHREQGQWH